MKILEVYKFGGSLVLKEDSPFFRLVWQASFADDMELLKTIIDYSSKGMFCRVITAP